ncbi:hypothetical protein [Jiella sp. M17.18]|uniref:hypothetical protein n=1 Tax=Jiella sp. M17.18 TaxID=3234247 RepID=UPI0034DF1805
MSLSSPERQKNLQYVRDMLEQLKVVSGAREGSMLFYLMDMARLETEHQLERLKAASQD